LTGFISSAMYAVALSSSFSCLNLILSALPPASQILLAAPGFICVRRQGPKCC
jgi:hypothetical protein